MPHGAICLNDPVNHTDPLGLHDYTYVFGEGDENFIADLHLAPRYVEPEGPVLQAPKGGGVEVPDFTPPDWMRWYAPGIVSDLYRQEHQARFDYSVGQTRSGVLRDIGFSVDLFFTLSGIEGLAKGAVEKGAGKKIVSSLVEQQFKNDAVEREAQLGLEAAKKEFLSAKNLKLPPTDPALAGTRILGYTTPNGSVYLQPDLSRAAQLSTLRHESVHAFFSPRGNGPVATFRQNLGQWGYDNSHILRFTEEAIAETYGSGSLLQGLRHPLANEYINARGLLLEGGAIGAGIGGAVYLLNQTEGDR